MADSGVSLTDAQVEMKAIFILTLQILTLVLKAR